MGPSEAIEFCKELVTDANDLPERAEDFAASVIEKVESIQEWIEENDHVTDRQVKALRNMRAGVDNWDWSNH